ncbi:MAG TPA: antibiotic biosynthesis monooxygenase [Solirubrobacteraceae bacterium]|jgi:quinol monooxygenase YgiN|nr:antibiotic biosynthesis monooxygenase [Solirubrobacteraceae bacterium]
MPVLAVADLFGIAGRREELLARLSAARADGAERYTYAEVLGDPDHFLLVGEWTDQTAMDAHYASAAFAEFQRGLDGLLARPTELNVHVVSATVRPVDSGPMDPRDAD